MSKQTILVGTAANDGTGDTLRAAAIKVNSNFTEVYNTAQEAFDKSNTAYTNGFYANTAYDKGNSAYSLANAAFNKANTLLNDSIGHGLNMTSNVVVQMQYDPTNTFDLYDIKSGSWLYMDTNGGLVFQSNTTGSLSTTVIDSGGTLNVSNNIVGTNGLNIQGNQNGNSWLHLSETNAINTVLGNDVGHIQITAYDQIEINSGGSVWTFSNDNFLHSPWGSKFLIAPEPTHSTGQAGDLQGMVAFSANGTYYCTADYVAPEGFDPEPNIWKRISWSSDTW